MGVAVVQPLERTRNVDVELKVVLVLGPADLLEVADDVLVDVGSEWLRGVDLIVGGRVEVEDLSANVDDLTIVEDFITEKGK